MGCLVPFLFAIYVNDLIDKLRQSGFGLYVGSLFVGCILYADDIAIALLSCSCYGLQKLIVLFVLLLLLAVRVHFYFISFVYFFCSLYFVYFCIL